MTDLAAAAAVAWNSAAVKSGCTESRYLAKVSRKAGTGNGGRVALAACFERSAIDTLARRDKRGDHIKCCGKERTFS